MFQYWIRPYVRVCIRPLLGPPLAESCSTELNSSSVILLDKYASCIVEACLSGGLTAYMEMQLAAITEILDPASI